MKDPFEILLDDNNNSNVVFTGDDNNQYEFEQVAHITLDDVHYVLLHPLFAGFGPDDVVAYCISSDGKRYEIIEVEDDDLLDEIYKAYQQLIKNNKKKK